MFVLVKGFPKLNTILSKLYPLNGPNARLVALFVWFFLLTVVPIANFTPHMEASIMPKNGTLYPMLSTHRHCAVRNQCVQVLKRKQIWYLFHQKHIRQFFPPYIGLLLSIWHGLYFFIANLFKYQNILKRIPSNIESWLKTILMLYYWPSPQVLQDLTDPPPPLRQILSRCSFGIFNIYYLSGNDLQPILCNKIQSNPPTNVSKKLHPNCIL